MSKKRKSKNLPKISIVIPSYNKVDYINDTLQSIADQKYPDLEIIIQDGGSNDGTLQIIKKFAKKYPKVFQWESKEDKGQTDAINIGLEKARGDILAYINADDVYGKGALKTVGEYFVQKPNTLWLSGRGCVIDAKGKEISTLVTKYKNFLLSINRYSLLLMVNYLVQPSIFLSRKAFEKYGPFTGAKYVMEYDLWLKIAKQQMPKLINKTLSSFRLEETNASSTLFNKILADDYNIVKKYTRNPFILFLHKLHNLGRRVFTKIL